MAQPHAQPQPLSVAHGDDSSPAMRLACARIAGRFERYISLQDPQLSSDAAWHSSAVQRYAPSFLHSLVTHNTCNDGQPVKAQTLIYLSEVESSQ
ncbi:hypothetical protein K523DRAFT_357421 [Schizophyllum commune Tattone D]|nr:hypothetical protein K523DRAFT_357421 [Schizophyllum commune Tattone D]